MNRIILIGMCIGFIILFSGCKVCDEYFSEENPDQRCIHRECYDRCHSLDYEYFMYSSGGFGSAECWCRKYDNTTIATIQIY